MKRTHKIKNENFTESFNNAIYGLRYAFRREKNIKIQSLFAILVVIASLVMNVPKAEFIMLCFAITLVLLAELINTAIEVIVNSFVKKYHPKARIIKDVSAGAVLFASANALVVGYLVFIDRFQEGMGEAFSRLKHYSANLVLIAILITVFLVILVKIFYNQGTPLKGGMPSGHTAVAFSITTAVALWFPNTTVVILCLCLSLLVAQSRIEGKIHSLFEVFVGAILGILVTFFLYKCL